MHGRVQARVWAWAWDVGESQSEGAQRTLFRGPVLQGANGEPWAGLRRERDRERAGVGRDGGGRGRE